MNQVVGDLHIHTLASGHAYSTVWEIAQVAKKEKMEIIGISDHGPSMPGAPQAMYFEARGHFPREIEGIKMFMGAEVDIVDKEGKLDLPDRVLKKLDYAIVSFHPQVFLGLSLEENTEILLRVLDHPWVEIVAHLGNPKYPIDYQAVVKKAVACGKLIEINNSSFSISRRGSAENCQQIALAMKAEGGKLMVTSDAHYCGEVGNYEDALDMLREIQFPEERIINLSREKLEDFLQQSINRRRQR
ncbi:MAG: putative hydrolase [Candidatus Atribacteria bacterium]|nr:putative hydrolase [Candidatus Atribacteria bacterium]